jgi:phosphoglycerate dehydrogenase-like enzyme
MRHDSIDRRLVAVGPQDAADWLRDAARAGGAELVDASRASALIWGAAHDAAGVGATLAAATNVRWVQLPFAGIENFVPYLDTQRLWTSGKGVYAEPVAELCLAFLLSGLRHVIGYARTDHWSVDHGRNLFDAHVVVVGGGGIAESLIALLRPFRVRITVVRARVAPMADVHDVVGRDRLQDAISGADAVVLACALTPSTERMLGAEEFALMRDDAWVINVGRGRLIDTDALARALESGSIAGAALDVTDPEPLPDAHPLWRLDNCLITPHIGNTREMAVPLLSARVRENCRRWIAGEPLVGIVDVGLGY